MSLVEIVRSAAGMRIEDEDGNVEKLRLSPALTLGELDTLERNIPCPIPTDVRELLMFSRGFENGPLESVCFAGVEGGFGLEEVFPDSHAIAHDGFGNYWVVDLLPNATAFSPIFYACHDPPVIVYQTDSFEHFIRELLRFANPPHESELNDIHEGATDRIWGTNPGATPVTELRGTKDATLKSFAESLPDTYFVVDLRSPKPGDGFSWGRFGPRAKVCRHGDSLLFAYESKTKWQRFLGR